MTKPFFSWRQAILDADLESNTKLVLLVLSTFMNDHGTGCYPTMDTIALKASLSKRTVVTHIQKAIDAQFIVTKRHGFAGYEWRNNEYRIAFPKPKAGETIAPASTKTRTSKPQKRGATAAPRSAEKLVQPLHHVKPEAGATISPPFDEKLVQLVQEAGANDDTKLVQQLHSISPVNSPYNSPELPPSCRREGERKNSGGFSLPETGIQNETENDPRRIGAVFAMYPSWAPREHFNAMLATSGLPFDYDWEPDWQEFVQYWLNVSNCPRINQAQWESKFRTAVLSNRAYNANKPTPLPVDWQPSPECLEQLRAAGLDDLFITDLLPEFTLYWRDDGSAQRSWNTKFIEWVRNKAALREQSSNTPKRISENFRPSLPARDALAQAGIPSDFIDAALSQFIAFWLEDGKAVRSWNAKFIDYVKSEWQHAPAPAISGTAAHLTDTSWAPVALTELTEE